MTGTMVELHRSRKGMRLLILTMARKCPESSQLNDIHFIPSIPGSIDEHVERCDLRPPR